MAPTRSAPSRKKTPEAPASVNKSQVAARTMFCDTTTATAHSPVMIAMVQNKNTCNVMKSSTSAQMAIRGELLCRLGEIGRASCRERVKITVDEETYKK